MLYIFCFIFHAEIISSFFLMSAERINLVGYSRRVKIPTNLTTTVPEVSHNYAFLLQHSRFCHLTCSPIGRDDSPEPSRWALQASLWKRKDSMISSWTSCQKYLSNTAHDACWPTTSKYCAITELGSGPRKM